MATLTDYLPIETLKQLASMFSTAAGGRIGILASDGALLAGPQDRGGAAPARGPGAPAAAEVKILLAGQPIGSIALLGPPAAPEAVRLLGLMRDVVSRLCEQAAELRVRIEELAAMHRLTEVFSGQTDLHLVHRLVAETMVKVTGADACSIRTLSEDGTELVTAAAYGLSQRYMSKGRILLKDSRIDQEVFSTGRAVYVADERTDPRVLYKAEARREGLVSALCAAMTHRGRVEGVIRVYTRRPHVFDWFETSLIQGVAWQAGLAVANARLYQEAIQAEAMRRQVRLAGEVQRRMIPPRPPRLEGLDLAAIFVPCFEVGGDFYDFIEFAGRNLGLAVGDVAGKGVQASLRMASVRSSLRAHAGHLYELARVLKAVNADVWRDGGGSEFVTLFYGVLNVPSLRLTYASAGHEPPILLREGKVHSLRCGGRVLGLDPNADYPPAVVPLQSGDALLIYTDGLTEAMNFRDEVFGRGRVCAAAMEAWRRGESAENIGRHLLWQMRRFAGLQTAYDDLTLVVIRVQ